ncbi:hypothetical protein [Sulfurovum mangrovi]|uniref:hypothetical protein n=1 Tax=Sulfurovum mangrovi TaxID=2893889 RepID=UPI001E5A4425|nr:hypothetical protein [Sulfurovum mangrovi]UFH58779.1 hypothetical protein LN246_10555 [Sulfurovum mangrovi]
MKKVIIAVFSLGLVGCMGPTLHTKEDLLTKGFKDEVCSDKSVKETYNILLKNIDECYDYSASGVGYGAAAYNYSFTNLYEADRSKHTILTLTSDNVNNKTTYNKYYQIKPGNKHCKSVIVVTSSIRSIYEEPYLSEKGETWANELKLWLKGQRSQCPAKTQY